MDLLSFDYQLIPELAQFGSRRLLAGNYALPELVYGQHTFKLSGGIDYELELTNTGEGILLRGKATAKMITACDLCLEVAQLDICGDVEAYFVVFTQDGNADELDDEFTMLDASGTADLAVPIYAAIVFELPQVILCKSDCAGLCPVCGINQNLESCNCKDRPDEDSPFFALKDLAL